MLPCEMPNAFAISSTWIHLTEYTRSQTFLHISSSVASSRRPDQASSYKYVLPHSNSPTQPRVNTADQGSVTTWEMTILLINLTKIL